MSDSNLAKNIFTLMKKNKITATELSDQTWVAEITINNLRTGQNANPTISTLIPIADFFGTTVNDLLADNLKQITVLNENSAKIDNFYIDTSIKNVEFAIKITHNNYSTFKNGTLLLVNNIVEPDNSDYIAIKINNKITICSTIIEFDAILGRSLSIAENIYKIDPKSLLGVITGALWLKK